MIDMYRALSGFPDTFIYIMCLWLPHSSEGFSVGFLSFLLQKILRLRKTEA